MRLLFLIMWHVPAGKHVAACAINSHTSCIMLPYHLSCMQQIAYKLPQYVATLKMQVCSTVHVQTYLNQVCASCSTLYLSFEALLFISLPLVVVMWRCVHTQHNHFPDRASSTESTCSFWRRASHMPYCYTPTEPSVPTQHVSKSCKVSGLDLLSGNIHLQLFFTMTCGVGPVHLRSPQCFKERLSETGPCVWHQG